MKALLKLTLTLAALFTPAIYVIVPAVAVCMLMDSIMPVPSDD
jgi:hypothetical protein